MTESSRNRADRLSDPEFSVVGSRQQVAAAGGLLLGAMGGSVLGPTVYELVAGTTTPSEGLASLTPDQVVDAEWVGAIVGGTVVAAAVYGGLRRSIRRGRAKRAVGGVTRP